MSQANSSECVSVTSLLLYEVYQLTSGHRWMWGSKKVMPQAFINFVIANVVIATDASPNLLVIKLVVLGLSNRISQIRLYFRPTLSFKR